MPFCQRCGKETYPGAKFCTYCGLDLSAPASVQGPPTTLTQMPQQKPPSDLAKIIIIVCVVLFVVLLLAVPFIIGLIGGLTSGVGPGGGSTLVPVTGQLTIPSGSGRGTLSIEMMNTANSPITSVSVVVPSSLCTGCSLTMKYNGLPISSSNPLPIGSTASGIVSTTSGSTGTTYSITATILFQGGGQQVQTVDITALL